MAKLGSLVVNIGANTKDLNMKLGRVRRDMRKMSSNFKAIGANMTRNLSLPLAAIGAASLNLAVEFESSMAAVKAVSGATGAEFKKLEQSAKDLGASTVFTARDVAALQLEYSRLGFSAEEILQVQEATLNLAQATGSDLAQAADVAGSTLRAFGLDANETTRVTDVMAASFNDTPLAIDNFTDSMKHVAPIARAAGVTLEETTAMLGVLAKSGIRGSQAGTALRRILQEMQGTSGTLTERFAELAAKGIGVEGAMDEVGRRAATSLLVLTEGAGQVATLTNEFANAEGAAKSMADTMNDTTKGSLKEMTSALEAAGIALGEVLIPFLASASVFIKQFAIGFKELSPLTQGLVVAFGALVAVTGPLLILLPSLAGGISMVSTAIAGLTVSMSAIAAPIAAVALIVGGLAIAYNSLGNSVQDVTRKHREFAKHVKDMDLTELYQVSGVDASLGVDGLTASIEKANNKIKALKKEQKEILSAGTTNDQGEFDYNTKVANTAIEKQISLLERKNRAATEGIKILNEQTILTPGVKSGTLGALKESISQLRAELDLTVPKSEEFFRVQSELVVAQAKLKDATSSLNSEVAATPGSIDALRERVTMLQSDVNAAAVGSLVFTDANTELKVASLELEIALKATGEAMNSIGEQSEYPINSLGAMKDRLSDMNTELLLLNPGTQAFIDKLAAIEDLSLIVNGSIESIDASVVTTTSAFKNLGVSITDAFVDAIFEAKNFGDAMLQIGKQLIKTLLGEAMASAIANASSSKNLANQASGGLTIPGFILGAVGTVKNAFGKIPVLAGGGLAFGETMSLVGDNRNAALDPEVIAPLSKLKDYIGGGQTNVYGRISGDDIVISNSRGARDRNRFV